MDTPDTIKDDGEEFPSIEYAQQVEMLALRQHPAAPTIEQLARFVELLYFTEPVLADDSHSNGSLPPCWARHPDIIERLVALYWMRKEAFSEEYDVKAISSYYTFLDERIVKWLGAHLHCIYLHKDPAPNLLRIKKAGEAVAAIERADELLHVEVTEAWEKASPEWKEYAHDYGDPWAPITGLMDPDSPAPTLAYSEEFERPKREDDEDKKEEDE